MPSEKPQVIVRVSPEQKAAWEAAAGRHRLPLAAYIRKVMDADATPSKGAGDPGVDRSGEESPQVEPPAPSEDAELTEPGGAKPEAGAVMPPGSRRDTDARRAALGARSLDVPGSVSSGLEEGEVTAAGMTLSSRIVGSSPSSSSVIKTVEDAKALLAKREEVVGEPAVTGTALPTLRDPVRSSSRSASKTAPNKKGSSKTGNTDLEWLMRRAGRKS